ncbi:hypothetical protein QBC42DRAFT_260164 [Cladorrhinum samala]|uniref:NADH dehydrogenase subunit 4 n=1 Tax=Cladorrhinum samala TaxID=585594 RepID=A0AAV9HYV5_9PEZI|nr:hypothetical protein QBC42DRAFT_260164 [Cladorrhinum samala]
MHICIALMFLLPLAVWLLYYRSCWFLYYVWILSVFQTNSKVFLSYVPSFDFLISLFCTTRTQSSMCF